jgi:hypothetical protein
MTTVNAIVEDVHPAYAGKDNLGSIQVWIILPWRSFFFFVNNKAIQVRGLAVGLIKGDSPLLQDARKLINKFWELSKLEKPPYRVAFGEDAKVCAGTLSRWFCCDFFSSLGSLQGEMDCSQVGS